MKLLFILLSMLSMGVVSRAQTNLVPNPSFEEYYSCPEYAGEVHKAKGWRAISWTPDYLHVCATIPALQVPRSVFGFQYPSSGQAYMQMICFQRSLPNAREIISTKLSKPLSTGTQYSFSMKVSRGDSTLVSAAVACSHLGMHLFVNSPDSGRNYALKNFAHVYHPYIVYDTANWVEISGTFIADSAYEHLAIGVFFEDTSIDTVLLEPSSMASYLLDDVCLSDSLGLCSDYVYSSHVETTKPSVTPWVIPSHIPGEFFVEPSSYVQGCALEVYNAQGQRIGIATDSHNGFSFTGNPPRGVYYLRVFPKSLHQDFTIPFYKP